MMLTLSAWLLGRVVSDRYLWSQFLLWIPTLALLPACAAGCLLSLMAARNRLRRRLLFAWTTLLVIIGAYFLTIEHRLLRSSGEPGDLRIVHWTMSHGKSRSRTEQVSAIIEQQGDITILQAGGSVARHERLADWSDREALWIGTFSIITPLPVIELREIYAADGITLAIAVIDTTQQLGMTLRVLLIDWPSDPKRSRFEIARAVRARLDRPDAPAFDVVIGDFNTTRGSASIRHAFPDSRDAFGEAGAGYGASFHRDCPLYLIDHVLLRRTVRATRYELVDSGYGRHLMQAVDLVAAPH